MTITEKEIVEIISDALYITDEEDDIINDTETFDERGLLTHDNGLVVSMRDGTEFQITVKQSR